ncbi:unnamed protein product, partial [Larinioides sclopetarius]
MISVDKKIINKEDRNGLCNTRVHSKGEYWPKQTRPGFSIFLKEKTPSSSRRYVDIYYNGHLFCFQEYSLLNLIFPMQIVNFFILLLDIL